MWRVKRSLTEMPSTDEKFVIIEIPSDYMTEVKGRIMNINKLRHLLK